MGHVGPQIQSRGAGFAIMAGAGIPGGHVLGQTDAEGGTVTQDEYFSDDIAATIYKKLGIPLDEE